MKRHVHAVLSLYVIVIFVQSLFFKFARSPETIYIFEEKLDPWAASLGFPGLFAPGGIFSAYVIGSFELLASVLLLAGLVLASRRWIQGLGALLSMGIISGAIFFHLFTPLGVAVRNTDGTSDGGQLFMLACGVWVASAILVWMRRGELLALLRPRTASGLQQPL
ncbi:MAG TPA: hypothetical protein VJM11_12345 [Nevskiaceae bacterium]|nr:hypothetical protein [Nevskiaceae bacterium]